MTKKKSKGKCDNLDDDGKDELENDKKKKEQPMFTNFPGKEQYF